MSEKSDGETNNETENGQEHAHNNNYGECEEISDIVFALKNFTALGQNQLSFCEGDQITILQKTNEDWWWAQIAGQEGYVPTNHITEDGSREEQRLWWQDEEYFGSYANIKLHHEMVSDQPRTLAYKRAIEENVDLFKGKVVLDVGCGTGILSMFCAKLGQARKVFAVEASDMAEHTQSLVRQNNLDGHIDVYHSAVEDIELPEKADVIISEWMGTVLLFELMIESVLSARDRWLKPGGLVWPSVAHLYLVPCSADALYQEQVTFWESQYGFDFSPLKEVAKQELFSKPIFNHVLKPEHLLCQDSLILTVDMHSLTTADLEQIDRKFSYKVTHAGTFHGFGSWFSIEFGCMVEDRMPVKLETGPHNELTHWRQDLFVMDHPVAVGLGDVISGTISIIRNVKWRRHLRIQFHYQIERTDETSHTDTQEYSKLFYLWR